MATSDFISMVKDFISKVESDPGKYKDALGSALKAIGSVQDVMTKLSGGDHSGAKAVVTGWEDVDRTNQATAAVERQTEEDAKALTSADVVAGLGAAAQVALTIFKLAV